MRMISPQVDAPQVTIAEEQEQYKTVTAALVLNENYYGVATDHGIVNTVLVAFRLSREERKRVSEGDDIYIALLTCGQPMQPINVFSGAAAAAAAYGLKVCE